MKSQLRRLLEIFGIGITSAQNLQELKKNQTELFKLREYLDFAENLKHSNFPSEVVAKALSETSKSTAQLHQDLIALMFHEFKRNGYFVEFGATDGVRFSNTHLLEKSYAWNGILAEPGKNWHKSLKSNRTAKIETKCVWSKSDEILEFNETEIGELSTLEIFSSGDMHSNQRVSGNRYNVETISLEDLLDRNQAPKFIEYLSIDTEGSEFQILNTFNFSKYTFGFISCEHNYTASREEVYKLMAKQGYTRVLEDISLFDDWYVHNSLIKS